MSDLIFNPPASLQVVRFVAVQPKHCIQRGQIIYLNQHGFDAAMRVAMSTNVETDFADIFQIFAPHDRQHLVAFAALIASRIERKSYQGEPYVPMSPDQTRELKDLMMPNESYFPFLRRLMHFSMETNYLVFVGNISMCKRLARALCVLIKNNLEYSRQFDTDFFSTGFDVSLKDGSVTFR